MNFLITFPQAVRHHAFRTAGLLTGLWLCTADAAHCHAQSDDFNDADDLGWNRYNPLDGFGLPGTFTFTNGGYRIRTLAPSPSPLVLGRGRSGSLRPVDNSGEFYISVDLVDWDDALPQAVGLLARIRTPGLGTTTGYAFTWTRESGTNGGTFDITMIDGEVPDDVPTVGNDAYHLVPGNKYRLAFIGQGDRLEGRLYLLPDILNPLLTIVGFDSSWDEGVGGLLVYDNSDIGNNLTDATFDNFASYDNDLPRLKISRPDEGEAMTFSWPYEHHLAGFKLQWASSLSAPVWNDVPESSVSLHPTNPHSVSFQITPDEEDGQRFYRLVRP
jgi:hypothetical protein